MIAKPAASARARNLSSVVSRVLISAIRLYQRTISVALPPACRFNPSCSEYAAIAVSRHGPARGLWLALRRLSRCGPWHAGGLDPVP
ncbi:MAG: membrane protein insertion efficiency factor YidD [Candidatus Eremiobacter antarcticus]|nr:membrane protein insertion efficiency factor YidD [Candidatus Eremiobacteraeota bacterium]MBC5808179.1 membrane protein insertion efficiency factor YidD [Candidatus Eremiobacteraeota bacterium]PZR63573.1 MAG: membrane protein insertion efficiency factor YidD [Candidatus Eremiobacter sp. RRmetagenome_bin22]